MNITIRNDDPKDGGRDLMVGPVKGRVGSRYSDVPRLVAIKPGQVVKLDVDVTTLHLKEGGFSLASGGHTPNGGDAA